MAVKAATAENIALAAEIIREGGIVSFPTETVYGLGADALNPTAVAKIFETKKRPFFDPLIVHIAEKEMLQKLSTGGNAITEKLINRFWPGPLTLVLEKKPIVPDLVTSGLPTVAIRMPSHPVALELIKKCGSPVAAPSANPFGCLSPTTAGHVERQLGNDIEVILDGGPCRIGIESTIIKIRNDEIILLRAGGISAEEIEDCTGARVNRHPEKDKPEAPGQLPWHYSPEKRIIITDRIPENEKRAGFLLFQGKSENYPSGKHLILSENGDLREAAANLFSHLHSLDSMDIDMIYAEKVPMRGLGCAIMDRLNRAAQKYIKNS